jgi:voltage-gated potassium channel
MADEPQPHVSEGALRFRDRVRSPGDLQRLSDFDQQIYLPLMLSAILPIVTAASRASTDSWVSIIVNVAAWIVFVIDLTVHVRLVRGYLRTGVGVFDLVIVIITAPWFLLPGLGGSEILVLARLARLVRLLFVSKSARRAGQRLGKVGLFAAGMLFFCSWIAYVAERATNSEFNDYWSSLWWGIVTLTTVGYGDIVPETTEGRFAGTLLMLTGIATLGLISGTLASMFRLSPSGATESEVPTPADDTTDAPVAGPGGAALAAEVTAVREQLAALDRRLAALADVPGVDPPPSDGTG